MRHSGAGKSKSYDEKDGPAPETHWYRLENWWATGGWDKAINRPGQVIVVTKYYPVEYTRFYYYDKERGEVLSDDHCPNWIHHHHYQTCGCCGQYGKSYFGA